MTVNVVRKVNVLMEIERFQNTRHPSLDEGALLDYIRSLPNAFSVK